MNEKLDIDVKTLRPFTKFIYTIGELPSSYLMSMTYEEQLIWLCNYLTKTVIPTINNNAEAVKEVQDLVLELQEYINNYFDNLDVQEEINNKLDDMAESGQLTDIIAQYLGLAGVLVYNTISEMKEATNLAIGSVAKTLGYRNVNDGGSCYYKVREIINTDVVDEKTLISLSDVNLVAELVIISDYITPEMLGAYGDGLHDDTASVSLAINYANSNKLVTKLTKTYLITSQMEVNGSIDGENIGKLITNPTQRFTGAMLYSDNNLVVKNLYFDCQSNIEFVLADKFVRYNNAIRCNGGSLLVDGCEFHNLYNVFIECKDNSITEVNIINNKFYSDNKTNIYMSPMLYISNIINDKNIIIKNNSFKGYIFTYVDTINNDYNCNACAITCANVNVNSLSICNNLIEDLGKYGSDTNNPGLSRLCTIDFYYNVTNVIIKDNIIKNCHWSALRLHGTNNALIENNYISMNRQCSEACIIIGDGYNSTGEVPVGTNNVKIINNIIDSSERVEQCLYITGYSKSDENVQGIYGSIDNLLIQNNNMLGKYINGIVYDCSLKNCIIDSNNIKLTELTGQIFIKANQSSYIVSTLTGVDYSNTKLSITNNLINTLGACIYLRGLNATQDGIFDDMIVNIEQNKMQSGGTAYCIYGTTTSGLGKAVNNIIKAYGGIATISKAYNNVIFYNSASLDMYNVTTKQANSSYVEN